MIAKWVDVSPRHDRTVILQLLRHCWLFKCTPRV